jgi:uncharacterized protein (TIGR03437 family)
MKVTLFALLTGFSGLLPAQSPPQFTVTGIGILPGFAISQATALSSNGTVVGYSATSGFQFSVVGRSEGWIFSNGVLTPISNTQNVAVPLGVNAAGQVVGITGSAAGANGFAPFWYQNGAFNTPAGFPADAVPIAISDTGPSVAMTIYPNGIDSLGDQGGVWANNAETVLSSPSFCFDDPNSCRTQVTGISTNGLEVSGAAEQLTKSSSGYWPVVWSNGSTIQTFLAGLPALSFVAAVNNSGQAVGYAQGSGTLFNSNGTYQSLGSRGVPLGINNSGWIVGAESIGNGGVAIVPFDSLTIPRLLQSVNEGSAAAVLWVNGDLYELNTCSCVTNASGWDFEYAFAVNDAGQIAGTGFHNGVQTAFLLTPASNAPAITGIVSASDFGAFPSAAPGSWVEIYGSNLSSQTGGWTSSDFKGNTAPTTLDSVSVSIGGAPAFVDYVSPNQVNAQLPSTIATGGMLPVTVTNGTVMTAQFNINVNATEPGLLAPTNFKIGGNQYVVAQHSDGSYVLPQGAIAGVSSRPAQPGETVVIYGVGFGPVTPDVPAGEIASGTTQLTSPIQILFGSEPASLAYSGLAPGLVGLYQFNVIVPFVAASDLVPLTFKLGGVAGSQTLYTAVGTD